MHKLFTLKHMAVYWDAYNSFMNPGNVMELKAKMYSSIYSTINKAKHTFILEPLSAEIKVIRVCAWSLHDTNIELLVGVEPRRHVKERHSQERWKAAR